MIFDQIIILISIFLSLVVSFMLFNIIYILMQIAGLGDNIEKLAAYECGFYPFKDTRQMVRIRYYLIAILYIIFDIEIILFIPIIFLYNEILLYINPINYLEFFILIIFLGIITLGFLYEWFKSALTWE